MNNNQPNVNIENINVNPTININIPNCECKEDENIEEIIGKYENINFKVLKDKLGINSFRYELYPIKTFKEHIKNQLAGLWVYLYEDYINDLYEVNNKANYQENVEEYYNNFNLLFKLIKEVIRKKEEIIENVGKEKYNYIIHIATVMMVSEWSKYKIINEDKKIRAQIIRGPHN